MANYPAHGTPNWDDDLKAYLDEALAGGSSASLTDTGYDIVLLAGQSNMVGESGGAPDATVDIVDPRIWSYNGSKIAQASDPLPHVYGSQQVGPGMQFARWFCGTLPGNRRTLLVPCAVGGTAFTSGTRRWDPTLGPNVNSLYEVARDRVESALAAAPNGRVVAILWLQGESDAQASASAATYRTQFEYLIDGFRDRFNTPNLPFVIGGMVPEFIADAAGTTTAIAAVHAATPLRKPYTAYVAGPAGMQKGDRLHYSPAGAREMGRRFAAGLSAARANATPANAVAANPPAVIPGVIPRNFADNFNRTDDPNNLGDPWVIKSGTWGIIGGQAYRSGGGTNAVAVVDPGVSDYTASVKVGATDQGSALLWRATTDQNWYCVLYSNTGFTVFRRNGGAVDPLGNTSVSIPNGATVKVVVSGPTFKVYVNDVQAGPDIVDATYATGGAGLRADGSARFDDFAIVVA